MQSLSQRLASISQLTERTYSSTLSRCDPRGAITSLAAPDPTYGVDTSTRPPPTSYDIMINAALERSKGGALWSGLPVGTTPARPSATVPSSSAATAEAITSEVVASRLRSHPNKAARTGDAPAAAAQPPSHAPTDVPPPMERGLKRGRSSVKEIAAGLEKKRLSATLEHFLEVRPSIEALADKQIVDVGRVERAPLKKGASVKDVAAGLEKRRVSATLEHFLEVRPSIEVLADKKIVDVGRMERAPLKKSSSVKDVAAGLEKRRVSATLEHFLEVRPSIEHLADKHIVDVEATHHVSPAIAGAVHELAHFLERRPTMEQLAQSGIVPHEAAGGHVSVAIAAKLHALERQRTKESLGNLLMQRADPEELRAQGILKTTASAPEPASTASHAPTDLEPPMFMGLKRRPSVSDVAKGLEKRRMSANLENFLQTRPAIDHLAEQHIVTESDFAAAAGVLSPALAGAADSVAKHLTKRPSLNELEAKGIVPPSWATAPGVNPALAESVRRMEKMRKVDAVAKGLMKRPSLDELTERGIIKGAIGPGAPSAALQSRLQALHKHGTETKIESALARRPSIDVLMQKGILKEAAESAAASPSRQTWYPPQTGDAQLSRSVSAEMRTVTDNLSTIKYPSMSDSDTSYEGAPPPQSPSKRQGSNSPPAGSPLKAAMALRQTIPEYIATSTYQQEETSRREWLKYYANTKQWQHALELCVTDQEVAAIHALSHASPSEAALAAYGDDLASEDKQNKADFLARSLTRRPTKEQLVERGIIKGTVPSSPGKGDSVVGALVAGAKASLQRRKTEEAINVGLENRPSLQELRARGILPEFLFASGWLDAKMGSAMSLDQQFDLDDEDEEYEYEVRNSHADSWDKVEVIDLGENGEEDDEDYDDDDDDDEAPAGTPTSGRVDISDLPAWLDARGGIPPKAGLYATAQDVEYDPVRSPRDDYTERAEPPMSTFAKAAAASSFQPAKQPRPTTTATADEMRPLLGSPTSGGGLTGLQASLDKQLDDLRSKWDTLFRQKEASSNAGGLSDEQRRRAQEELQRALGGF